VWVAVCVAVVAAGSDTRLGACCAGR
jgi:hypothetical protein